jgi:hypothetical protein
MFRWLCSFDRQDETSALSHLSTQGRVDIDRINGLVFQERHIYWKVAAYSMLESARVLVKELFHKRNVSGNRGQLSAHLT